MLTAVGVVGGEFAPDVQDDGRIVDRAQGRRIVLRLCGQNGDARVFTGAGLVPLPGPPRFPMPATPRAISCPMPSTPRQASQPARAG